MGWTLLTSTAASATQTKTLSLPKEGIVHIVQALGSTSLKVVQELRQSGFTELGRISIGPWGAKLEAVDDSLSIVPGQAHVGHPTAANDPRVEKYELQPRVGDHSEVVFLRHGDAIRSSRSAVSLTCNWDPSEVQVNSSATEAVNGQTTDAVNVPIVTPEEDTEDEDLDNTITAVKATQGKSQQVGTTPQLSHQRSVLVQETPTTARTDLMDVDMARSESPEKTPSPTDASHVHNQQYSTARTGESQIVAAKSIQDSHDKEETMREIDDSNTSASPPTEFKTIIDDAPGDIPTRSRQPKVVVPKKRSSPTAKKSEHDLEVRSRSAKRTKTKEHNDNGTQDSISSNVVVDTAPVVKGRKRKVEADKAMEIQAASPSRSQRSSQRSNPAAVAELYEGPTPCVALSSSSITDKHQAIKFLKKQGGSLAVSMKDGFNILCTRDGDLHKTPKVLRAIAGGIPIVTDKWLLDSAKAGHFLAVEAYQPSAPAKEKEWNFSLKDIIGQPQNPFQNYTIHFTNNLQSAYQTFSEIEQVCLAAGAKKVSRKRLDKTGNVIVLALDEGDAEAEKLMQEGMVCYNRDLLPNSIFRGYLDLESDEFKIRAGDSASKDSKKRRGKKS